MRRDVDDYDNTILALVMAGSAGAILGWALLGNEGLPIGMLVAGLGAFFIALKR